MTDDLPVERIREADFPVGANTDDWIPVNIDVNSWEETKLSKLYLLGI